MAVLRASGLNFAVDLFAAKTSLPIDRIYRLGECRLPQPSRSKHKTSGVAISVSDASWSQLRAQIRDAEEFLAKHGREITRLSRFPGVEHLVLEFNTVVPIGRKLIMQAHRFPAPLVRNAGKLGIALELAIYPGPVSPSAKVVRR